MLYKKTLKISIITLLLSMAFFCVAAYVNDPLQIFHKPWGRKVTFSRDMRDQAIGIIKHYDFDSIIIGNSLMENTSADEASSIIGGSFVNLSASGMVYNERSKILDFAAKTKKIQNVINVFDANFAIYKKYSTNFSPDAYQDSTLKQIQVYGKSKYLKCILLFKKSKYCVGEATSLDSPSNWENEKHNSVRFGGFENWIKNSSKKENTKFIERLNNSNKYINRDITNFSQVERLSKNVIDEAVINIAKENPNTNFHIVLPPYLDMFWVVTETPNTSFNLYTKLVRYLVNEASELDNLNVYWFYDYDIASDINEYKDALHYSSKVNSLFLKSIAKRRDIVTIDNIDYKLEKLSNRVDKFDPKIYLDAIDK